MDVPQLSSWRTCVHISLISILAFLASASAETRKIIAIDHDATLIHKPADIHILPSYTQLLVNHPELIIQMAPVLFHQPVALVAPIPKRNVQHNSMNKLKHTKFHSIPVIRSSSHRRKQLDQPIPKKRVNPNLHRSHKRNNPLPKFPATEARTNYKRRKIIQQQQPQQQRRYIETEPKVMKNQKVSVPKETTEQEDSSSVLKKQPIWVNDRPMPSSEVVVFDENEQNEYVINEKLLDPNKVYVKAVLDASEETKVGGGGRAGSGGQSHHANQKVRSSSKSDQNDSRPKPQTHHEPSPIVIPLFKPNIEV